MLVNLSIRDFSDILASVSPAPGGGSVAALSGALGADLVVMVCNLSLGKADYELFRDQNANTLKQARDLSKSLLDRVDSDTEAFNEVMAAFKKPKGTDEQKNFRQEAIQIGYKKAIQSPLEIARECLEVLRLAERLLGKSNSNALSDLGVASQQAYAGLEGAVMNVKINMPSIKDKGFVAETGSEIDAFITEGRTISQTVYKHVAEKLGK